MDLSGAMKHLKRTLIEKMTEETIKGKFHSEKERGKTHVQLGRVLKLLPLNSRSDSDPQGSAWGQELYGICLVYWLHGRGYEGPSGSLEIGLLKEKPRFMVSGIPQVYCAGQSYAAPGFRRGRAWR